MEVHSYGFHRRLRLVLCQKIRSKNITDRWFCLHNVLSIQVRACQGLSAPRQIEFSF
jgi:hypothetical protein